MKKELTIILAILFIGFASADLLITQQPGSFYNLGDTAELKIKVATDVAIEDFFLVGLLCNGKSSEIYREFLYLEAGEEKEIKITIPLIKSFTSTSSGSCRMKAQIESDYILTNDFQISNSITTELKKFPMEITPGNNLEIEGIATKKNGESVEGFADLELVLGESSQLTSSNTINQGFFQFNVTIPADTKAGQYLLKINTYERDKNNEKTNEGFVNYNILLTQIPRTLELILEDKEVVPGTNLKVKTILHDQTGEAIQSKASLIIRNSLNEILLQKEIATGELYELPIATNQTSEKWTIFSLSNSLEAEEEMQIMNLSKVEAIIVNNTLTITNIGNIPYTESVIVNIGEQAIEVKPILGIGQEKRYILNAPEGSYDIEALGITQTSFLTGKAISVREVATGIAGLAKHPIVWIFLIIILAAATYIFFKKGYKRSLFGYFKRNKFEEYPVRRNSLVMSRNKAEISLSIKGSRQNISAICLKIKNLRELESQKGASENTLQKIVNYAEDRKACTYENQDNIFFLFFPSRTRSSKNEKTAILIAEEAKKLIEEHNKIFKDKIHFGISINYGTILVKDEEKVMKFMSIGNLLITAKKLAMESKGEVLLGENFRDQAHSEIKAEKIQDSRTPSYKIKEIKEESQENSEFINNFLKRLEKK